MSLAKLGHASLHRPGSSSNGATVKQRDSADFLVNGESLLARLVATHGGHDDYMGCFVHGFPDAAKETLDELLVEETGAKCRVGIYICPECGDIGCGRFSVMVEQHGGELVWSEFMYENGYEDPWTLEELGPFRFDASQYENAICEAAKI